MRTINFRDRKLLSPSELNATIYGIKTCGYAVVTNFLTHNECETLKKIMFESLLKYQTVKGSKRSQLDRFQLHELMPSNLNFSRLLEDPRLEQLLIPHLGPFWTMYAATSSSVPPKGTNYANRIHIDSPRFSRDYVFNIGVIWCLDEYHEKNGALEVLPGSHHAEDMPEFSYFEDNVKKVLVPSGSLIIFHARLWHRTAVNLTDQWRHSMTLNGCRSFMKPRMNWVQVFSHQILRNLNSQAKRIIGFDSRVPNNLNEFFVPEKMRMYKPNQG